MDALLIVDFQNDFVPGGALAVSGGDEIAEPIARLLDRFELVIATRDWHPSDHASFEQEWPVHCVQDTPGAELHRSLDRAKVDVVVDKGRDPASEGYSAFQDTHLAELLRARDVDRLYVAGLATDYCVAQSVLDARRHGFEVVLVEDAVRGVDRAPGDSELALAEMTRAGATLTTSAEILGN